MGSNSVSRAAANSPPTTIISGFSIITATASALGAEVTVLSRTADKSGDARELGAAGLLLTTDDAHLRPQEPELLGHRRHQAHRRVAVLLRRARHLREY
jgi:hypothetical protein